MGIPRIQIDDRIHARRDKIAELRREGRTYEQIARELHCSIGTVHNDLKTLRTEWRTRAAGTYDELMAQELEQLEHMRHKAWKGYRNSIQEILKPEGDVRMLELARRCTDDIVKLLGLNDPIEFQAKRVTGEEGTAAHTDIVEVLVHDRTELAEIRDESGTISLAAYKERLKEAVRLEHSVKAAPQNDPPHPTS